ncbi:MAG: hypothetical protein K0M63_04845 [Weeksellaceae bacterium]|nr:hypothetical protein [Weeksellaceae bacterium]
MPESLHLLVYIFIGILTVVLLLIFAVLFYSFYLYRELQHRRFWAVLIDRKVSKAIVHGIHDSATSPQFAKVSRQSGFRGFFLEMLVSSEKKFSGLAQGEIRGIFHSYHLEKEAYKKLSQKKPYLIAGGIQELTAMNVEEAIPQISVFVNHPSPQVFQEARYAMAAFRGFEGLQFLDNISNRISDWQQLRLLLSITHIPEGSESTVLRWLGSPNSSVVIFTLSLLRKFQLLSHYPTVWNLLDHPNEDVRGKAVQTLQCLENTSTMVDLIDVFPNQPLLVQLEVLKAMKRSRDQRCVPFLQNLLLHYENIAIKIGASETLFALGHEAYLKKLAESDSSSGHLIKIIKHALQERVC